MMIQRPSSTHLTTPAPANRRRRFLLPVVLLLAAACAGAQSNDIRLLLPPDLIRGPDLSAQEKETIQRALQDLRSENPELRAGAVMLLGKYQSNLAKAAVAEALDDPSARVRRAALVSIAEWRHGLSPTVVEPVLQRLADEDLEVRRAVTAMIPQMMNIWRTARMVRPGFAHRELSDETQDILRAAYRDDDAVVRRNMLVNHHSVGVSLDPGVYLELLQDEDRKVRLEAIPLAIGYAPPARWMPLAEEIVEGDDEVARLRLTTQLARRGAPESVQLLQPLASDPNPEIAAEARLALFRFTGEQHYLDSLLAQLRSGNLTQDQSLRLLSLLRGYRELARPLAPGLTELPSAVLRQEAVRLFFGLDLAGQHPEVVDRLLTDSSSEVRKLVVEEMLSHPELVTPKRRDALLDNPYPDVRGALVQLAIRQPRDDRANLLLDLMLDESVAVRSNALEAIGHLRIEGWTNIVAASMQDPDFAMQRTAADILLSSPQFPQRDQILRDYVDANPDSPLNRRIRAAIGSGKMIEIDMNNL